LIAYRESDREQGILFYNRLLVSKVNLTNLSPESVIDITHESLIRNWKQLTEWAHEEYPQFTKLS
jgi:hypothetical protein